MDPSIRTATHDTSSAAFHIADFSSFLVHLSEAVAAAWPDKLAARYREVKVLLMSWEKDDLDVESDVRSLEAVFRGLYHYGTEHFRIPSKRSAVELSRKVTGLVDSYDQEGNLLILYYAGHSRPSEQPGGSPVWAANRSRDSPTVQSSIIHSLLDAVDCDVLLLHDCGHGGQVGEATTGGGVIETLAACGFESADVDGASPSFTASLVQELAHAAHTADWLSVVELHRRLIHRMQVWTPTISFADDSYSLVKVDIRTGQPMVERPRRRTPIHSFVATKPRTIVLSPLLAGAHPQDRLEDSFITLNAPATRPQAIPDGPGILVTCQLREQNVDAEKWKEWIRTAPEPAKNIQVAAIYPGFSAVLILELPLVVWDLLPPSPAISFVAYTTGKNHISDFQRALGLDPDESSAATDDESELEEDSEDERSERSSRRRGQARKRSRKSRRSDRARSSLWPKVFGYDRTALYSTEDEPYCLRLAELQADGSLSKTERILRSFVQDLNDPSMRYIHDEVLDFCSAASFEALSSGQGASPELVAMVDERSPTSNHPRLKGMQFLNHHRLFEALLPADSPPPLIETEPKADYFSPRRRLIYVTNLDPTSTLALVSTASEHQALFLRDFVYKHITFQSGMDVKFHTSGTQAFQLTFHLPFFAWRRGNKMLHDTRLGGDRQPLRSGRDVSFLGMRNTGPRAHIYEAQISCMIAGVDNRHWTAYGFFDTYHDGPDSRHGVRFYQPAEGEVVMDPLTRGRHAADTPIWTAREYFLRVMESCVQEAKAEWQNVGRQLLKALRPYARNARNVNWARTQRASHQTIQVLEQLTHGLAGTIAAWERFRDNDLAYFDLDSDAPATDGAAAPRTAAMVQNIDNDIRELRALEDTLRRQTDMFKTFTSRHLALSTNRNTARTTALAATAVAFLPFGLAALVAAAPDILVVRPTPARYALASAVLAFLAAVLCLALMQWWCCGGGSGGERAEEHLLAYFGAHAALAGEEEVEEEEEDAALVPRGRARKGGLRVARADGVRGVFWRRPWWAGGAKGQKRVSETETERDAAEEAHGLPF